jgi:hypothetical protein
VWAQVNIALSPRGNELSPGGSWDICAPALPEGLTKNVADREAKMSCSYIEGAFIHSSKDKCQSSNIKGSAKKWADTNTFTPSLAIEQDNVILKFPFNNCATLSIDSITVYEFKDAMTIKEQLVNGERFSVWRMETQQLNDEKGVPSS